MTTRTTTTAHIAIVGAGPAGIYAADILQSRDPLAEIDIFEKLPAPYGLVRYGVSPDHPRIKKIQDALHEVLENPRIRLICNVEIGDTARTTATGPSSSSADVSIAELLAAYDAVVIATGADRDQALDIPGAELAGSFGGADFVAWYDGHPDVSREWPLDAEAVAVIGAGNVALDVARMIVTRPADLERTDIPAHVEQAFRENPVRDLHMLIRRGPADVRFSAMELRELGALNDVDMIVDPADMELDEHAERMIAQFTQRRIIVQTLREWSEIDPATRSASRRVHLHFYQQPSRILGEDRVSAIEMERTSPNELGRVTGTGEMVEHAVGAVYRTIGYRSSPVDGVPFDETSGTIPDAAGRVLNESGVPIPGLYTTGWIRRGPVGLIGSTKSDAAEAITSLLADVPVARTATRVATAVAVDALRDRLPHAVDWRGWLQIDAAERELGETKGRERTKIVDRDEMLAHAKSAKNRQLVTSSIPTISNATPESHA